MLVIPSLGFLSTVNGLEHPFAPGLLGKSTERRGGELQPWESHSLACSTPCGPQNVGTQLQTLNPLMGSQICLLEDQEGRGRLDRG